MLQNISNGAFLNRSTGIAFATPETESGSAANVPQPPESTGTGASSEVNRSASEAISKAPENQIDKLINSFPQGFKVEENDWAFARHRNLITSRNVHLIADENQLNALVDAIITHEDVAGIGYYLGNRLCRNPSLIHFPQKLLKKLVEKALAALANDKRHDNAAGFIFGFIGNQNLKEILEATEIEDVLATFTRAIINASRGLHIRKILASNPHIIKFPADLLGELIRASFQNEKDSGLATGLMVNSELEEMIKKANLQDFVISNIANPAWEQYAIRLAQREDIESFLSPDQLKTFMKVVFTGYDTPLAQAFNTNPNKDKILKRADVNDLLIDDISENQTPSKFANELAEREDINTILAPNQLERFVDLMIANRGCPERYKLAANPGIAEAPVALQVKIVRAAFADADNDPQGVNDLAGRFVTNARLKDILGKTELHDEFVQYVMGKGFNTSLAYIFYQNYDLVQQILTVDQQREVFQKACQLGNMIHPGILRNWTNLKDLDEQLLNQIIDKAINLQPGEDPRFSTILAQNPSLPKFLSIQQESLLNKTRFSANTHEYALAKAFDGSITHTTADSQDSPTYAGDTSRLY